MKYGPQPARSNKQLVLDWLASIGETDEELIADTIARCREDKAVRAYFVGRATCR